MSRAVQKLSILPIMLEFCVCRGYAKCVEGRGADSTHGGRARWPFQPREPGRIHHARTRSGKILC